MGNPHPRITSTMNFNAAGQFSSEPSGVVAQSKPRTQAPNSRGRADTVIGKPETSSRQWRIHYPPWPFAQTHTAGKSSIVNGPEFGRQALQRMGESAVGPKSAV